MPADIREIILADGHSVNASVRVAPRLSYPHINGASNPNACHDGLLVLRTMVYERLAARHPRSLLNMRSQAPPRMWPFRIGAMNLHTEGI